MGSGTKPRLVLLFGAGSTLAAGAPSVNQITDHVRALGEKHDLIKAVVDGLEHQRGKDFNFEHVIYALDELTDYLLRKKRPDAWDLVGGVLSAFSQISPPFDKEPLSDPFQIDRFRIALLASIDRFVSEKTRDASTSALAQFLERLRKDFRLTVFTLNYDDLIDRAGNWFDGFATPCDAGGPHSHFDLSQFLARFHSEPSALAHLHGSVRFGYHDDQNPEIVEHGAIQQALKSLELAPSNAASPIISGFEKETMLLRTPIPFAHYYHAFAEAILSTPRFLIAGYGGRDPHVNTWFGEFMRVHSEKGRVVVIDKGNPFVEKSATLLPLREGFPPTDETTLRAILQHLLGQ